MMYLFLILITATYSIGLLSATHLKMANSLPEKGYYRLYQHFLLNWSNSSQGFDSRGKKSKLSDIYFKKDLVLKDVYLASKISEAGYLTLPPGMFGSSPEEQYLNLLANTKLNFDLEEKHLELLIKTLYVIPTNKLIRKSEFCISIDIPIITKNRIISFSATGGNLSSGNLAAFNQFFTDNVDFSSFFKDQVLKSKEIDLKYNQTLNGLGNCVSYGYFRFGNENENFNELDIGLSIRFPSGKKSIGKTLWEIDHSEENSILLNLFGNFSFQTDYSFFNPYASLSLGYHFGYHKSQRVPSIKNEHDVNLPPAFDGFIKRPFSSFDVTSRDFADLLSSCSISGSFTSTIVIGNSCRCYLGSELELLTYLQFDYKKKNSFAIINMQKNPEIFNTKILESFSKKNELTFSWALRMYVSNLARFSFGSEHVIAGTNTPSRTLLFAQCALAY